MTEQNLKLLQPMRHLRGEPSYEALWLLFKAGPKHGDSYRALIHRYFGRAKRGPHAKAS